MKTEQYLMESPATRGPLFSQARKNGSEATHLGKSTVWREVPQPSCPKSCTRNTAAKVPCVLL
jgi:hypothetical protein